MVKSIDVSKVKFSKNVYKRKKDIVISDELLKKSVYYIDVTYRGGPLYIQFPRTELIGFFPERCAAQFEVSGDIISDFIDPLQEHIITSIHRHSDTLFRGKRFTLNKLRQCMLSAVTDTNIMNVTISSTLKVFNSRKQEIEPGSVSGYVPVDCIPLVKLTNLQFIDNRFTYNLSLEQLKVFTPEPLAEYSIIDNNSKGTTEDRTRDDEYFKDSREIDSVTGHFFGV